MRRSASEAPKQKSRPRFWLTMLALMLLLMLVGLGQWDIAIAVLIGLTVGNVGSWLLHLD